MSGEGRLQDDESLLFKNQEEIAEEFGVFRTMTERDFYAYHLFQKAKEEKDKKEKEKQQENRK